MGIQMVIAIQNFYLFKVGSIPPPTVNAPTRKNAQKTNRNTPTDSLACSGSGSGRLLGYRAATVHLDNGEVALELACGGIQHVALPADAVRDLEADGLYVRVQLLKQLQVRRCSLVCDRIERR